LKFAAALGAAIATLVAVWLLLTGGPGEALSRRLCGDGLASVPCVLLGVVLAYLLPLLAGVIAGLVVLVKLDRKQRK